MTMIDYHLEPFQQDDELPPNITNAVCPKCPPPYNNCTYLHDLQCPKCDNATIVCCTNCGRHWKVKPN